MSCHTCNRLFTEGCLADPDAIPYVTFVRMHPHGHQRLYAGKIVARGVDGYRILTPGYATHFVKFHRIRCAEPRVFNDLMLAQARKKFKNLLLERDPETYDTVYYDFQIFGDI